MMISPIDRADRELFNIRTDKTEKEGQEKPMKTFVLALCIFAAVPVFSLSGDVATVHALEAQPIVAVPVAPAPTPVPDGTPMPAVAVAEPAAPPVWAQELLVFIQQVPVIGPYASKAIFYLGIVSSLLTAVVICLLTILNTLIGVATAAGWVSFSNALVSFRDGRFMYWLKFMSAFNAKKPQPKF